MQHSLLSQNDRTSSGSWRSDSNLSGTGRRQSAHRYHTACYLVGRPAIRNLSGAATEHNQLLLIGAFCRLHHASPKHRTRQQNLQPASVPRFAEEIACNNSSSTTTGSTSR